MSLNSINSSETELSNFIFNNLKFLTTLGSIFISAFQFFGNLLPTYCLDSLSLRSFVYGIERCGVIPIRGVSVQPCFINSIIESVTGVSCVRAVPTFLILSVDIIAYLEFNS